MPIAITFFAGQGEEPTLIKIGTAYESATHHRTPPPDVRPGVGAREHTMNAFDWTRVIAATGVCMSLASAATAQPRVPSRPETVVWGEIPIDRPPVLRIRSGASVSVDTLSHSGATQDEDPVAFLARHGVGRNDVLQDVIDFWNSRAGRPREGRAGHILTGPIYIDGAEPGDTVEIRHRRPGACVRRSA